MLAAAAVGAARPARADEPPPSPAAALAKVAVIVMSGDARPLPAARAATVQVSMEHALAADPRLDVIDLDEALAESAGAVPKDAVSEARGLVASGEELLRRGQARAALLKLEGAASQLAGVLAWAQKQELAQAQFLRGAAHAVLGEDKAALEEFVALLAWRPDFAADPTIAPGKVLPLWEKASARARRLPGGSIDVTSQPAGAMAYADGRFVGFTPTTIEGLPVGTHYVTVRARGFQKAVLAVRVSDKQPVPAAVTLAPSPRAADLAAAIEGLRGGLGAAQASAETQATLGDLSELLGVDQIVVLVTPSAAGKPYLGYVYGAVGGMRLATAEIVVADRELEEALGDLAATLYRQVSFAPPPVPPPPPPHVAGDGRPFYRRWWFWTAIGAAAGSVVAGAVIVHERNLGRGPTCPAGDSCGAVILSW